MELRSNPGVGQGSGAGGAPGHGSRSSEPDTQEAGRPALKPCGTEAAYQRHRRQKTVICAPCREAHRIIRKAQREAALARKRAAEQA